MPIYDSSQDYQTGQVLILWDGDKPSDDEFLEHARKLYDVVGRLEVETPTEFRGMQNPGTATVNPIVILIGATMKNQKIPTKPGTAFGGGFYAGRFYIGADAYALIVAPKAEGQIEPMPWNKSLKLVTGATSYCDGMANTMAMAKAGSALAKQVLKLRIGGFKDWHLPSRLQLLIAYHELATAKAFAPEAKEAFDRASYWSSTQHAEDADSAWVQYFDYGYQGYGLKGIEWRARAVRTIKL